MPWITRQNDDEEWCVVEVDDEENEVEEVICFADKDEADDHRAGLEQPAEESQPMTGERKKSRLDLEEAMARGEAVSMREYFGEEGAALSMRQVLDTQEAVARADAVMGLCYAFMDVTWNIMWAEDVTNKVGAIASAAEELGRLIPEFAQMPTEMDEPKESPMATEQKPLWTAAEVVAEANPIIEPVIDAQQVVLLELSGRVIEAAADPNDNRRAPLEVKTVYIAAGAGNKADARYYSAHVLEQAASGGVFNGVKMFLTDHDDWERSVRTEAGFTKDDGAYDAEIGGVVGTAVIIDPDYAEKTRNLRDAGRLDMQHDSIYGYGTSESGDVDGETYNVVTELTSLEAIDWVSRAGAGGRALQAQDLAETYKKAYGETEAAAEVTNNEEEESVVERGRVDAVLAEFRGLPESVVGLLAERQYISDESVRIAATDMVTALEAELGAARIDNPAVGQATDEPWTQEDADKAIREANKRHLPNCK